VTFYTREYAVLTCEGGRLYYARLHVGLQIASRWVESEVINRTLRRRAGLQFDNVKSLLL
jgi:hypothetical protein